jgi:transposase
MLMLPSQMTVYVARDSVDMRKSIDGLSILVRQALQLEPKQSALFVFFNKGRDKIKVLYWDRTGFAVWYKRLAKGRYRLPEFIKTANKVSVSDLTCILEGIDLLHAQRHTLV